MYFISVGFATPSAQTHLLYHVNLTSELILFLKKIILFPSGVWLAQTVAGPVIGVSIATCVPMITAHAHQMLEIASLVA